MSRSRVLSPVALIVTAALVVLFRLIPLFSNFNWQVPFSDSNYWGEVLNKTLPQNSWSSLFSVVYLITLSLFTMGALGKIWIPESNKSILILFVFLFASSGFSIQVFNSSYIIPLVVLAVLFIFFSAGDEKNKQATMFNLFFILTISVFLSAYVAWLIPYFFMVSLISFKLNLKEITACLLGTIVPVWIFYGVYFFISGSVLPFTKLLPVAKASFYGFDGISDGFLVYLPIVTIISVVAFIGEIKSYSQVSIIKRKVFYLSHGTLLYTSILFLLSLIPLEVAMLIGLIPITLLFAKYFSHHNNVRSVVLFFVLIISVLLTFVNKF